MSRWIIQSILSEVDLIKFAFVSRKIVGDKDKHNVLGIHTVNTKKFAKELNIQINQAWNKIRYVANLVIDAGKTEGQEEEEQANEFVLLKENHK